jgi:hypothetical protein
MAACIHNILSTGDLIPLPEAFVGDLHSCIPARDNFNKIQNIVKIIAKFIKRKKNILPSWVFSERTLMIHFLCHRFWGTSVEVF